MDVVNEKVSAKIVIGYRKEAALAAKSQSYQSVKSSFMLVPQPGNHQINSLSYTKVNSIKSSSNMLPMVVEQSGVGERAFDIYSRLLRERIVFLGTPIDDEISNSIIAQLLFLDSEDSERDIQLYINSPGIPPGGFVTPAMAIYDTIQQIRPDVVTICFGAAAGLGALLLASGAAGKRMSLPDSRLLIHQPLGGAQGQAADIEIRAKEIIYHKSMLNQLLAQHTGQSLEKIEADSERNFYLSAQEAKNYGLIDQVILRQNLPAAGENVTILK